MKRVLIAAVVLAATSAGAAFANDREARAREALGTPPDEGINLAGAQARPAAPGTPADAADRGTADKATADKAAAPKKPVGEQIVSPDAATAVDEEDLIKKLTGEEKPGGGNPAKKFEEILGRMGASAGRLKGKDPGEVTQENQRRIVTDLDVLIDIAKKSESSSSSQQQQQQQGQKKQQSKSQQNGSQSAQGQGGTTAAQQSTLRDGTASANPNDKNIHEVNQETWHNLPPRDRDAITNAPREEVLPQYRAMMEKYYEELAKNKK